MFDETYGVTYPTISGVEGGWTAICNAYGIGAYPTVILIAPDHTIVEQDIWPIATAQTIIDVFEGYGLEQTDCSGVGLPELNAEKTSIISSIYPNPANSIVNIEVVTQGGQLQVEVYNIIGIKVIESENQNISSDTYRFSFSVAELPAGTYFVNLKEDGKTVDVQKIAVLRVR